MVADHAGYDDQYLYYKHDLGFQLVYVPSADIEIHRKID
jgi:hypothetical protein